MFFFSELVDAVAFSRDVLWTVLTENTLVGNMAGGAWMGQVPVKWSAKKVFFSTIIPLNPEKIFPKGREEVGPTFKQLLSFNHWGTE